MLMDVYVFGTALLFCLAECSELDSKFQGGQEDWKFKFENDVPRFMAVVPGKCKTKIDEKLLSSAVKVAGGNPHDKQFDQGVPERLKLRQHDVMSFSWKLMRKADGKVQILMNREPVTMKDQGANPSLMVSSNQERGLPYHLCLEASANAKDAAGKALRFIYAVMRLRCYYENPNTGVAGDSLERVAALISWDLPSCDAEGFAVEVGLAVAREPDSPHYGAFGYLAKYEDLDFFLQYVLRRWV